MKQLLEDKIALVTGGSRGLGKAVVENFIEHGAKVAFTWKNSEQEADLVRTRFGDRVLALQADASNYDRAAEVLKQVVDTWGRVDVLVCNVGGSKDRPIWEIDAETFEYAVRTTLFSCFNYVRATAPYMIEAKCGSIVSIGSVNGIRGREGNCGYCAGKSALSGFIKTVAKELGEHGIRANIVAPGYIDVESQRKTSELIKQLVLDECTIRRLAKPEEIADTVLFLASEMAKNITGQTIVVDCGQIL
ncbi:MAG: SDR family NAD(P)-dependent oxidoreductase [Thermoguttaceae bacterium]